MVFHLSRARTGSCAVTSRAAIPSGATSRRTSRPSAIFDGPGQLHHARVLRDQAPDRQGRADLELHHGPGPRAPLTLHHEADWLLAHLRALVDRQEAGRPEPWSVDDPPEGYIETQAKAIVGLEMRITSIEAKRKLSQNRIAADFQGVVDGPVGGLAARAGGRRRDAPGVPET